MSNNILKHVPRDKMVIFLPYYKYNFINSSRI